MGGPEARLEELIARLPKTVRLFARREIRSLSGVIGEGEEVLALAQGRYRGKQGLLAATNLRLVFLEQGLVRRVQEDFAYDRISSVGVKKGLAFGALVISASGNEGEVDQIVPKATADEVAQIVRSRLGATGPPPTAVPSAPAAPSPADQVRELAKLRDEGMLSEEEFETKRREILGL